MSAKFFAALLVSTFVAGAANAAFQTVPQDRMSEYRTAISSAIAAINDSAMVCYEGQTKIQSYFDQAVMRGGTYDSVLERSNVTISVDNSGTQPSIMLVEGNSYSRKIVTLTTSSDYKSIVAGTRLEQSQKTLNDGNLMNPQLRQAFTTDRSLRCHLSSAQ